MEPDATLRRLRERAASFGEVHPEDFRSRLTRWIGAARRLVPVCDVEVVALDWVQAAEAVVFSPGGAAPIFSTDPAESIAQRLALFEQLAASAPLFARFCLSCVRRSAPFPPEDVLGFVRGYLLPLVDDIEDLLGSDRHTGPHGRTHGAVASVPEAQRLAVQVRIAGGAYSLATVDANKAERPGDAGLYVDGMALRPLAACNGASVPLTNGEVELLALLVSAALREHPHVNLEEVRLVNGSTPEGRKKHLSRLRAKLGEIAPGVTLFVGVQRKPSRSKDYRLALPPDLDCTFLFPPGVFPGIGEPVR